VASLDLQNLPALPQSGLIRHAAEFLWRDEHVQALWLGGSFSDGRADEFSDVDLRVAVPASDLPRWRKPDWRSIFGRDGVGNTLTDFGADAFLNHLVLDDGTIFDFFVQSDQRDNKEHAIKVLGCRSAQFAARLATFARSETVPPQAAAAQTLRQLIIDTWIISHKHRKVLARGLHLLMLTGLHHERSVLIRLWYAEHTGMDMAGRPSIHSLTPVTLAVQQAMPARALEIAGMPQRTEAEIIATIETFRDELARFGQALAKKLNFEYPHALEQVVRASWRTFLSAPAHAAAASRASCRTAP
jgi:hypothetical protein